MSQIEGRIKCVALVSHPTNTLVEVVDYMQNTLDSLATARVQSKLASDFQRGVVFESKMKVNERPDGTFQLYPKVTWAGSLKPNRVLSEVLNDAVQDLATYWQADLESRGYTVLSMYIKDYTPTVIR